MLGIFAAGAVTGGGIVANDKLSQADQLQQQSVVIQNQGLVAGAATTEPSEPVEQWVKPLDYSNDDLEVVANLLPLLIEEARHQPTAEEIANQQRRDNLRAYFQKWNSPFADSDETLDAFLHSSNMKMMIAISFVESTMGKKCYHHNCSGIGGYPPNLRKYDSHAAWVRDFDSLLERRYKGWPVEKFLGVYVQPGSPNWLNGVKQILAELDAADIE